MEKLIMQVASQGFGYLLFVIACFVIYFLYKENKQLNNEKIGLANQTVQILKEAQATYTTLSESSIKVAENTYTIVQNLQQVLNSRKQL